MKYQVPASELARSESSALASKTGDVDYVIKAMPGQATPPTNGVPTRERVRRASGVVLGLVLSYLLAGIIWAWLRPTYTVIPVGADEYQLGNETNVEFHGYLWFLLLSVVVALISSAWLISHREHWVDIPMYFWFSAWVLVGLFIMQASSNLLVDYFYPLDATLEIRYAPDITLGALGYVLAPCVAALTLWIGMLYSVGQDEDFADRVEPAPAP